MQLWDSTFAAGTNQPQKASGHDLRVLETKGVVKFLTVSLFEYQIFWQLDRRIEGFRGGLLARKEQLYVKNT
jgi:hypothetical protein